MGEERRRCVEKEGESRGERKETEIKIHRDKKELSK